MKTLISKYGLISGISLVECYKTEGIKVCTLSKMNEIKTPYGTLIPQYEDDGVRRKYTKSISFYENGNLKSISLNEQTQIETPLGVFPAELITFYENGNIKKIFPLNGKITGYWTEENEYELAEEFEFKFEAAVFKKKIIAVTFYESGDSIKGLTFWPNDTVFLQTPAGKVEARIGMTLYKDGKLKSFEPSTPISIETPIGKISAYNSNALGIHGDSNSFIFNEDGEIKALTTCEDIITVEDSKGRKTTYAPSFKQNLFNNSKMDIVPLNIEFKNGKVMFESDITCEYDIEKHSFTVKNYPQMLKRTCTDCSNCDACG